MLYLSTYHKKWNLTISNSCRYAACYNRRIRCENLVPTACTQQSVVGFPSEVSSRLIRFVGYCEHLTYASSPPLFELPQLRQNVLSLLPVSLSRNCVLGLVTSQLTRFVSCVHSTDEKCRIDCFKILVQVRANSSYIYGSLFKDSY